MITFESLCAALPSLTGEAVKVALALMQVREQRELLVDLSWRTRTARELLLHTKIVERSLKELSDSGLCELQRVTLRRIDAASMSDGGDVLRAHSAPSEARSRAESEATSRDRTQLDLADSNAAKVASVSESGTGEAIASHHLAGGASRTRRIGKQQRDEEEKPPTGDVQSCIAVFDTLFKQSNDGAKPTWGGRQYMQMRSLVEKHGRAEVEKRITIMFTAPPRWPAPPYDLATLVSHFDKFATPTNKGGMIDRWKSGESYYGDVSETCSQCGAVGCKQHGGA